MRLIQRINGGEEYRVINSDVGSLLPLNTRPLLAQILAFEQRLRGNVKEPHFLVFSRSEERQVITALRQVAWARPMELPKDIDPVHQAAGIRPLFNELLENHGLTSAVVPFDGGMDVPLRECVLAITRR